MSETIIGILSVSVLTFMYTVLWKNYCVDNLREKLFEIRGKLFDLASSEIKGFNFDHSFYAAFEKALNGSIKVAEDIRLLELIPMVYYVRKNKIKLKNVLTTEFEKFKSYSQNTELINDLEGLKRDYEDSVIRFLLESSAFVGSSLVTCIFIKHLFNKSKSKMKDAVKEDFHVPLSEFENQAQNFVFAAAA